MVYCNNQVYGQWCGGKGDNVCGIVAGVQVFQLLYTIVTHKLILLLIISDKMH